MVVGQVDSIAKLMKRQDEAIAKQKAEIAAKQAELDRRAAAVAKVTAATVAALRVTLNVEQAAKLDTVVAGFNAQLAIKDQQIEQGKAMYQLEQARVANRDSLLMLTRSVNDSLLKQLVIVTKQAKPSLGNKIVQYAGWGAAVLIAVAK